MTLFTGSFYLQVTIALIVDFFIGDPKSIPHPIRFIGKLIAFLEEHLYKENAGSLSLQIRGAILSIKVCVIVFFISYLVYILIIYLFGNINIIFGIRLSDIVIGIIGSFSIALKGLVDEGTGVFKNLQNGDLKEARVSLSGIVGRDTENLSNEDIVKATVETLAENASDGIIAPAFYFFIGGLPMVFAYKAINTVDSMIGYKNKRYKDFGKFGARLDDVANFIPARLTGFFIVIGGLVYKYLAFLSRKKTLFLLSPRQSFKTMLTDSQNHKSPNAGVPEAAMSGLLGIQLGGPNYYFGKYVYKPYIGTSSRVPVINDILVTSTIVKISSILFIICLFIIGSIFF